MSLTNVTMPDGSIQVIESNDAIVVYGVAADGSYLGKVPQPDAVEIAGFAPPDDDPAWRWVNLSWVKPVSKADMWAYIKAERDRRTISGGYKVTVDGVDKWFHSDTLSRSQQLGLVLLGANVPAGLQWKTMDGSFVTMTQTLASEVFASAAAQDQGTFAAAETHRAAMEASEDFAHYDYSGGWPVIFGG